MDKKLRADLITAGTIDATKVPLTKMGEMRQFESGAMRDTEEGKIDFEGFLSPAVLTEFAKYMNVNRQTTIGERKSDNWQCGIAKDVYMKSMFRHFMDVWSEHRGIKTKEGTMKALMGLLFNVQGYAFELLKEGDTIEEERP